MKTISKKLAFVLLSVGTVLVAAGCASKAGRSDGRMHGMSGGKTQHMEITLSGSQEVPPVSSAATGRGMITVASDKSISGSIMTSGIDVQAAHIHEAAAGANGPVIIPLAKGADNTWVVPAGAMLTDAQYASYMSGNLYVNVHSAAYPTGEIRAQLLREK